MRKKSHFPERTSDTSQQLLAVTRPDLWDHQCKTGIYGWRKKFLYILIIIIAATVVLNAALVMWIIMMLKFSTNGIGQIRLHQNGITLDGNAFINGKLYASSIQSQYDNILMLQSNGNITIKSENSKEDSTTELFIGDSRIEAISNKFIVRGRNGQILLKVEDGNVTIATDTLIIDHRNGINFNASIQTPLIQAKPFEELKLISPAGSIQMLAQHSIGMVSRYGDIAVTCLEDLLLKSKRGKITLESSELRLRNLQKVFQTKTNTDKSNHNDVYQLCLCSDSGKIFMAHPDVSCAANSTICDSKQRKLNQIRTFGVNTPKI